MLMQRVHVLSSKPRLNGKCLTKHLILDWLLVIIDSEVFYCCQIFHESILRVWPPFGVVTHSFILINYCFWNYNAITSFPSYYPYLPLSPPIHALVLVPIMAFLRSCHLYCPKGGLSTASPSSGKLGTHNVLMRNSLGGETHESKAF